eukprot:209998-Prymnesium_polylepis.2
MLVCCACGNIQHATVPAHAVSCARARVSMHVALLVPERAVRVHTGAHYRRVARGQGTTAQHSRQM